MQRIEIIQTFPFSVDKLYSFLSDHHNLELIFAPAKIKRIKDGKDSVNGVGSTRWMKLRRLSSLARNSSRRIWDLIVRPRGFVIGNSVSWAGSTLSRCGSLAGPAQESLQNWTQGRSLPD